MSPVMDGSGCLLSALLRDLLPPDIFFIYCRERSVDYPLCCSLMGGKWHREKDLSCSPPTSKAGAGNSGRIKIYFFAESI